MRRRKSTLIVLDDVAKIIESDQVIFKGEVSDVLDLIFEKYGIEVKGRKK